MDDMLVRFHITATASFEEYLAPWAMCPVVNSSYQE